MNTVDSSRMLFSPSGASMAASSLASVELEVNWDPAVIRSDLKAATIILSQRCLKLAAKWAAEQLVGLPEDVSELGNLPSSELLQVPEDGVLYAKSLLELGEYMHAAAVLSQPNQDVSAMADPLPTLSPFGIYLRAYALYLAGERRKEEDYCELQSDAQIHNKSTRNPYLPQICRELKDFYKAQRLDAFGLYVYGMALKEAQKDNIPLAQHPPAHKILTESVIQFPYNWSAWLDLAWVALESPQVEKQVEQSFQSTMAGHYMYHFFCAHLMAEHQAHEDAMMLYERLMEPPTRSVGGSSTLFQSLYVVAKLGVAQYHTREFEDALQCFQQLHEKDPFRLEDMDIYSNILYVKEDRVTLSQLAHKAVTVDKYRPESCCIVGNYYSLKQQRSKAVLYFQRALKLDRTFMSAWTLMGHEYVELKNTAAAMESYRRAVHVSPKDYRAWYGLGQTYEFLNMHTYALFYYRKAAALRPYDARMWCAIGLCCLTLHRPQDAIRSYERAVNHEDTEGIATQKLAALYRQEGLLEKAAQCYLRHLELRYIVTNQHPSAQAPTTLDAVIQGLVVEAPEAEALLFLASYHKDHREYDTATLCCSRLLDYPGPEKEEAKGLMRELRSRKKPSARRMHTRSQGPPRDDSFEFSP